MGACHGKGLAGIGSGQDPIGRRTVRDLLALPARCLGGAVCIARVERPWAGDLLVGSLVMKEPKPMKMPETTGAAPGASPAPKGWRSATTDAASDRRPFTG